MSNYNENIVYEILDECVFVVDKDDDSNIYAEYKLPDGQSCCVNVRSDSFNRYLRNEYRVRSDERTAPSSFRQELQTKIDEAMENPDSRVRFYRRIAGSISKEKIYYALSDETRRAVKATKDGWKLLREPKVRFLNIKSAKAQVVPQKGGNLLNLLKPYFNLKDDTFLLFVICLVQYFSQKSDHFVMVISGPQGSGKSTATDIVRELVDPSQINKNLTPKNEDDLKVNLSQNYMVSIDNSKPLSEVMSNTICAAVTGASASKRKLYTNTEEVIMRMHPVVVLNGINIIPEKSDLIDRSLLFETRKISQQNRLTESELLTGFRDDKPKIFGAILDTLVKAIELYPTISVEKLHRMADAHKEMIAIAMALGIQQDEFQRILDTNIKHLQQVYSGSNEFVDFVVDYVLRHGKQEGPTSRGFEKMYRNCPGNKKAMPGSASSFSRKMNEERDALKRCGIQFSVTKKADANYIKIERVPKNKLTKAQKERTKQLASNGEQ